MASQKFKRVNKGSTVCWMRLTAGQSLLNCIGYKKKEVTDFTLGYWMFTGMMDPIKKDKESDEGLPTLGIIDACTGIRGRNHNLKALQFSSDF